MPAHNKTHGLSGHPLYPLWYSLKNSKPKRPIARRWSMGVKFFIADMNPGWHPGYKLVRKNPAKPFSKENCKWMPPAVKPRVCPPPLSPEQEIRAEAQRRVQAMLRGEQPHNATATMEVHNDGG